MMPRTPCLLRAHPRSRGENAISSGVSTAVGGSSPLTRGKRMRLSNRIPEDGSSPLTRGKPGVISPPSVVKRLIPAHAGKTGRRIMPAHGLGAHPRSRGENAIRAPKVGLSGGSSPLTRGKLILGINEKAQGGLIPAHAGKTSSVTGWPVAWRAHPRSRGENPDQTLEELRELGSSPLTRGKPRRLRRDYRHHGLIPAHAGKTMTAIEARACRGAHPRSRGENADKPSRTNLGGGSSPLTRGKRGR